MFNSLTGRGWEEVPNPSLSTAPTWISPDRKALASSLVILHSLELAAGGRVGLNACNCESSEGGVLFDKLLTLKILLDTSK